jgi:4-amino-4-deoxy-L-arabinose transferase-like glycosyltransferase
MGRYFWAVLVLAFMLRLGVAFFAPHPGISDSNHYYNLARNLSHGRGFVIDYIWNYYNRPPDVTHAEDYWMPLPAVYPAVMLFLFPDNLLMALLPSVVFGTAVVALTYALARRFGLSPYTSVLAMALVAFLPELVLNSARTDTTMSYVFYVGMAVWCYLTAWAGNPRWLIGVGIFMGLAHLSRQDAILFAPAILVTTLIMLRWQRPNWSWLWLWVIPVAWLGVLAPWMWRNYSLFGVLLSGGSSRTIFMTSFIDQFTYGRELHLTHWLEWGIPNIIGNIVFQALANVRMMLTLGDVGLSVFGWLGLCLVVLRRNRPEGVQWRGILMPLLMIGALFAFYSFVTPFHTQGGSFKKSFMLFLPFLAIWGAWWLDESQKNRGFVVAITAFTVLLTGMNAFQLVREDFAIAQRFNDSVATLAIRLNEVGDVNGDGEIIVMTQDPFILNYHGFRALMLPSDPRDMILQAAYRYSVDYIILPAARPSLDALYNQKESDPRLTWLEATANYQLLAIEPSGELRD